MDKPEEARKIFGQDVATLGDQELAEEITKFELLGECFLDTAERKIFKGKTLSEFIPDLLVQKDNFLDEE